MVQARIAANLKDDGESSWGISAAKRQGVRRGEEGEGEGGGTGQNVDQFIVRKVMRQLAHETKTYVGGTLR